MHVSWAAGVMVGVMVSQHNALIFSPLSPVLTSAEAARELKLRPSAKLAPELPFDTGRYDQVPGEQAQR